MSLTFYYAPQSSASPTHWILEELKVPYEKVRVDIKAQEQKKPTFLALNPNGRVPVLVHDGVAIAESVAIAIHLGETFGVERGLFPGPGLERAKATQWLVWCNASVGEALSRLASSSGPYTSPDQHNEKAAKIARADVENHLKILNAQLEGKSYLLGDTFSIVDAHLCSWMVYLSMFGFDLEAHAALASWRGRCLARPAANSSE